LPSPEPRCEHDPSHGRAERRENKRHAARAVDFNAGKACRLDVGTRSDDAAPEARVV
jgi:hypothetical protein